MISFSALLANLAMLDALLFIFVLGVYSTPVLAAQKSWIERDVTYANTDRVCTSSLAALAKSGGSAAMTPKV